MKLKDNTEFEAKFYPVNKEEYRQELKNLGAILVIPERKMIRIVADKRENPELAKNGYIRIRDEGNVIRLSLKITAEANGKLSDQKEIDVEVSDFEKTKKIIEAAGVKFNRRQETLREEWEYKGSQITIDTWPGLDTYSEIEADSEEKVKQLADELGFNWNKKLIVPAADVYVKVYGLDINDILEKISYISFEDNPFEEMKKVWAPKSQQE